MLYFSITKEDKITNPLSYDSCNEGFCVKYHKLTIRNCRIAPIIYFKLRVMWHGHSSKSSLNVDNIKQLSAIDNKLIYAKLDDKSSSEITFLISMKL